MNTEELKDIATGIRISIDAKVHVGYPRSYLGMSQLGHGCARYLWFYFRWAAKIEIDARKQRIFDRGNLEEDRIVKSLESIGIIVEGRQTTLMDCDGHMQGHTDGFCHNVPDLPGVKVLLEMKSMKDVYWQQLNKSDLKTVQKKYWAQDQTYMFYEGCKIGLQITTNKNDEMYDIQFVPYDRGAAELIVLRARDIIYSKVAPRRLSDDPDYFECNWCEFQKQCHFHEPFAVNCRTCQNSHPGPNATWYCGDNPRTKQEVEEACNLHIPIML